MQLDTGAHGYYCVGDQIYYNKLEALYYATKINQLPTWVFHDDVYSKLDWTQRPPGTLTQLYKERAQQIRDEYDYVIVHFGGGMDSWTVLDSFLSNGIHVDEVYTRWPRAERKYMDANTNNTHESNLGSEYEYATLPVLENIKKNFPNTYIYIDDISEAFHTEFKESVLLASNNFQSMGTYYRHGRKSDRELALSNTNKKIAVVLGHDKTCVSLSDNKWSAYFVDVGMGSDKDLSRKNEFFYWSPKFPLIPVLQAHCLIDQITRQDLSHKAGPIGPIGSSDNMRKLYATACYPNYNINTFQAGKPLGTLLRASESWISQYNPDYFKSWQWNVNQLINGIDKKYLKKRSNITVGINFNNSREYFIRSAT